jgi:hypothetical protein
VAEARRRTSVAAGIEEESLMRRPTRSLVLIALTLAGAAAGCADVAPPSAPLDPVPPPASAVPAPPVAVPPTPPVGLPPASAFPALARPGAAFVADLSLYGGALASRLVLYEGSGNTFALQFASPDRGFFEYGGRYAPSGTESGMDIVLHFGGGAPAGLWTATGTVRGDTLRLSYNPVMQMTDFVDGVYVRVPVAP